MAKEKNELAVANVANYPALSNQDFNLAAMIRENLQGARLSPFSLDRIKVPSGGDVFWKIPDIEKEFISEKVLSGIIIHNQYSRGYWAEKFGAGEAGPPQCESFDGATGIGNPGGACQICRFDQFGSAIDDKGSQGAGKACQEKRFLFMLRPDSLLPIVVQSPATSLRPVQNFIMRLLGAQIRPWEVIVDLTLVADRKGGYPTSIITPKVNARLSPDDCERVSAVRDQLKPMMEQVSRSESFIND